MIEVHLYGKLRRFTDNQDPTCDSIVYIPAEYHSLQRLTCQRERLMKSITMRKNRIGSIINGYLPDLRKAFSDEWSERARLFYRQRLNPFTVVRDGKSALETFLVSVKAKGALTESHQVYQACQKLAEFYEKSKAAGMINEDFFDDLQDEIAGELRRKEYRLKKLQEAKELLERERTYDTVRPRQVLSYLTPLKFLEQWKEKENQGKQGVYFAYLSNFV